MADERLEIEKVIHAEAPLVRGYPRPPGYGEGYGYGYGDGESSDGQINLRGLWRKVRKRKWLILVLTVIVTSVVTVNIYRTKSTYQASAIIEIGKDTTTLVKTPSLIVQADSSDSLKTKMLVLKSRPLLEDVVARLKLDQNPRFLDVTQRKTVLEAVKTILGKLPVRGSSEPMTARPLPTELAGPPDSARLKPYVDVLAAYLSIDQVPQTQALVVSFTHTDPNIAAEVANGAARNFIERSFESKTERFTKTSEWLDATTRKLQAKVEQAEEALAKHSRENNIFTTDPKDTFATDKLARLQDQVMRAETDRILKQSLYEEVKEGRVAQLPEAFADAKTGALEVKLNELATQAAELDVKFGVDNPRVQQVRQQMAAIEQQISKSRSMLEEKLKADFERAVREERSLRAALERAKSEAVLQNQANIQFNIIKQDVETSKSLYTEFLQKTSQAEVEKAEQHNDMRLIEPAQVPGWPVGPHRLRAIMTALFLSLVAGVGIAFLLDYLDNTIKTVEDVTRYAQLPALSVIPAISGTASRKLLHGREATRAINGNGHKQVKAAQLVALESRSSAAEAYRVLRTSVLLSAAGSPPKTILVTSGQPGEGKTTTVINTAISLAQLGASVLIIDCDLRRPSTHHVFGIDQTRGLSTYLSREIELDKLIHKLPIPNLWLLPCGSIPPNPAELISSEKMKKLLQDAAGRFDHILIDSPPLINVTDPVILSTMVDGVMLVVHGGKSTRDMVRRARQELDGVGAKMFGVVLNNVDLRREGYDDYYYYRYYSGYGEQNESVGAKDL